MNSNTRGLYKIFKFTLAQQIKSKSFKVATIVIAIICAILAALSNIIPAITSKDDGGIGGGGVGEVEALPFSKVYILDETGLGIDVVGALKQAFNIQVETTTDEQGTIDKLIDTTSSEVLITIKSDEAKAVSAIAYRPADDTLTSSSDVDMLLSVVSSTVYTGRLINSGVAAEDIYPLTSDVSTTSVLAGEEVRTMFQIIVEMVLPMVVSILLFYMIFMYGTFVSQSIVNEKSSRVMELLLTSVKPFAVVAGKVCAMGLVAITQFAIFIAAALLGFYGSSTLSTELINSSYKAINLGEIVNSFSPASGLMILVIFILGFALYATVSALCGSTISRAEEIQQANMPVSLMGMVGFYLAYFAPTFGEASGSGALDMVAMLCPLSSPFYLPGKLLLGDVDPLMLVLSIAILVITILLVLMFTAKVYSTTILHTGNRLKIKDLFAIAKNK